MIILKSIARWLDGAFDRIFETGNSVAIRKVEQKKIISYDIQIKIYLAYAFYSFRPKLSWLNHQMKSSKLFLFPKI